MRGVSLLGVVASLTLGCGGSIAPNSEATDSGKPVDAATGGCASAGGHCVLGGNQCADRAPSSAQDCNPNANPGGAFCCLDPTGDSGTFCSFKVGPVAAPSSPDPCIMQCEAPHNYCQQLQAPSGGWGCCVNPPLPDGSTQESNDCSSALCGRM
jgi:hypothetical protein